VKHRNRGRRLSPHRESLVRRGRPCPLDLCRPRSAKPRRLVPSTQHDLRWKPTATDIMKPKKRFHRPQIKEKAPTTTMTDHRMLVALGVRQAHLGARSCWHLDQLHRNKAAKFAGTFPSRHGWVDLPCNEQNPLTPPAATAAPPAPPFGGDLPKVPPSATPVAYI
jgi:hypothetical protein